LAIDWIAVNIIQGPQWGRWIFWRTGEN